jgi:drug/metabolite transporter (DMT)-like permease
MSYVYLGSSILLMVYCQLVIKWQVTGAGAFPEAPADKVWFLARLLANPWVVSALAAAFLAALAWMAALTRLELSHAYPIMSLSFVLVVLASAWLLHEPLTAYKVAGVALVCAGVAIGTQG